MSSMLGTETVLRSRNAVRVEFVRGMYARDSVLPSFGVSRIARFESMGEDMGLHISDIFASDTHTQEFGQNTRVCAQETYNGHPRANTFRSGDLADEEEEGRKS